jgi:hypothetical protein
MVDRAGGTDADAGHNPDGGVTTPTVFVATPMYGGTATGIYTVSMVHLPAVFLRNRVDLVYAFWNESLVPNARNVLAHQFLESQATHLMWIDADIGFDALDIISMLIADKDVVCGIYPKKELDWTSVAQAARDGVPPEELSKYAGSFAVKPLDGQTSPEDVDPDGLFEIEAGGTGFMLIKRGVFDALSNDVSEYVPDFLPGRTAIKEFYSTAIDPESGRLIAEDYHFCRQARNHGFKIYAAPWVRLRHAGTYIFDRSFDPGWLTPTDDNR